MLTSGRQSNEKLQLFFDHPDARWQEAQYFAIPLDGAWAFAGQFNRRASFVQHLIHDDVLAFFECAGVHDKIQY